MTISLHALAIDTFVTRLQTLAHLLERGAAKLDPAAMPDLRLAPDMYPLSRQVQIVCYQAVDAAARLAGREAPTLEFPEETLAQLQARIAAAISTLREVPADALVGGEDLHIRRPLGEEYMLELSGFEYLRDSSLPNFYFHLVTTYAILRHHGVEVGKRDYMGHLLYAVRPRT